MKIHATTPIDAATQALSDECCKALMRRKNDERDNELQADKKEADTLMKHNDDRTTRMEICVLLICQKPKKITIKITRQVFDTTTPKNLTCNNADSA